MTSAKQQSGVALVAVIFLVVVIGAALVVLARLSVQSNAQITQSLLKARAEQAASAGIEYAVQRLVESGSPADVCSNDLAGSTVDVPAYADFEVTLNCELSTYQQSNPASEVDLYQLTSDAEYGDVDDADYSWSRLETQLTL